MARPTNSNSADTLERIRNATLDLIEEVGPDAISFRRVAQVSGMSVGTVRHYFGTKDTLLEACLDGFHSDFVEFERQWMAMMEQSEDPRETVYNSVLAAYLVSSQRPELQRLRLVTSMKQGGIPEERRTGVRDPFFRNVAKKLAEKTGASEVKMRLVVDSVMRLVAWYATCSAQEVCNISDEENPEKARESLGKHCAEVATDLIFGVARP